MSDDRRPKRFMRSCSAALLLAVSLAAGCVDDSVAPAPGSPPPATPLVLGFVEVSFDGIGTPDLSSSMLTAPSIDALEELRAERHRLRESGEGVALDLTFPSPGNGTIQFGTGTGTQFTQDGVRYLSGTFPVRNAQLDGMAYTSARMNLTLLGVSMNKTVNGTAVRYLRLGDGSPAPESLALEVMPTGLVELDGGSVVSQHPDVLQVLTEDEVAAVSPPSGVTSIFPYAFVVRNSDDSRTLPASPTPDQFDGVVDFAFSIPEQATPDEDPQSLSFMLLAVDDSETRLTQSLQEQTPTAQLALQQRASALNADIVTLPPGGTLPGVSGLRTICSVRTAGTAGSATAHLVNVDWTFDTFTPDPYATDGSASHISSSADFHATFSETPDAFGPETFRVRGLQSGPAFLGQAYTLNGTTISTPERLFFPGEEIEVALTSALVCPQQPPVARYRVQPSVGTGGLDPDGTHSTGDAPLRLALGDLRGNGVLDLVVANSDVANISVLLGNGDGSFQPQPTFPAGTQVTAVTLGDVDGNGVLDAITSNWGSDDVSVLLGNGDGSFQAQQTFGVGPRPQGMALGDLNGNGILDIVVANSHSTNVTVLLGNGDGSFQPQPTLAVGSAPQSVALGDIDGNGILDSVVALIDADSVAVLLGNGDGTFQGPQQIPVGDSPISVALGDLTGNGVLDAVTANLGTGDASVLIGNGNGTFQPEQRHGAGESPRSVALGDLTGNGALDLVISNSALADEAISVLIGEGGGAFQPQNPFPAGSGSRGVGLGDLNGDGVLDVVVANLDDGNVSVLLGQTP